MQRNGKIKKAERLEIALLRGKGYGVREIARVLGRSPGSISEELKRNRTRGGYDPLAADHKARLRRRDAKFQGMKLEGDPALRAYVVAKLEAHWNPDEIAGRMREDRTPGYVSKTAIYDWLRSAYGQRYCSLLYSRRYRKRPRKKNKAARAMIPGRVSIHERFRGAANRTRYGHWEGDSLVSGRDGRGAVAVLYERKAKLVVARKLGTLSPYAHARILRNMVERLKVKSMTFDNGIENRSHTEIGVPTFFCDPYSSWQKGGVENVNKMIRRYLPKGGDLSGISQGFLDQIVSIINQKPRKSLGYRTAIEVATAGGLLLNHAV